MLKYKDTQGKLHVIESEEWVYLLPSGCVRITDEEAYLIENPHKTIEQVREEKKQTIRNLFEIDSNSDVVVGLATYQGGFDSAIKLDAAKRLAETASQTSVTFFDNNNVAHVLTMAEAQNVILTVAGTYQNTFARKQAAMVAIDAAKTITKVNAVVY